MNSVPVPYVIVSYSVDAILDVLASQAALSSFFVNGKKGVYLFDTKNNPNFISFVHEHSTSNGTSFTLELLDVQNTFEYSFLEGGVFDPYQSENRVSTEKLKRREEFITEESVKRAIKQVTGAENAYPSLQELVQKEGIKQEFITEAGNEITNAFLQDPDITNRRVYIAYGMGTDLYSWSGPHITFLGGMATDISSGARKLTLKFLPMASPLNGEATGMYQEKANTILSLKGFGKVNVIGEGYAIDFTKTPIYGEPHKQALLSSDFVRKGKASQVGDVAKEDYHLMVTDIIRDLASKITGLNNIIVLLPDINKACSNVKEEVDSDRKKVDNIPQTTTAQSAKPLLQFGKEHITSSSKPKVSGVATYNKVEAALKYFGIHLREEGKLSNKVLKNPQANWFAEMSYGRGPQATSPYASFSVKDTMETKVKETIFYPYSVAVEEGKIPNAFDTLETVLEKVRTTSTNTPISLTYFTETNAKLVSYWVEQLQGTPLFGGTRTLRRNEPFLIIGDRNLIDQMLYAGRHHMGLKGPNTLHPLDAAILNSSSYKTWVSEIVYKPVEGTPAFGWTRDIPGDFTYEGSEVGASQLKAILNNRKHIPIFRFNTRNPNVLKLSASDNTGLFISNLRTALIKKRAPRISAGVAGQMATKYTDIVVSTEQQALSYIRGLHQEAGGGAITKEVFDKIANQLRLNLSWTATDRFQLERDVISAIRKYKNILESNHSAIIEVDNVKELSAEKTMASFIHDMYYKGIFNVTLDTLPMFAVNSITSLGKPAVLFARDSNVIGAVGRPRTFLNDYLTGPYTILSFRHEISSKKANSTFNLVRTPGIS